MKWLVILSSIIGTVLLYLLSSASANTELFSHNYYILLAMTGLLALCLLALVASQIWQLHNKIKEKVFGAKLTLRLVLILTAISIIPGILVYAVSVQFLGKSIESWFDVRVEKALEGGLNLGRSSLENGLGELNKKAKLVALILAEQDEAKHIQTLHRLVDRGSLQVATIIGNKREMQASAGGDESRGPELPSEKMIQLAWKEGAYGVIDTLPGERLALRVLVPIKSERWKTQSKTLQFVQPVPKKIAEDAEMVQTVYLDYQQLVLSRKGLKRLYAITLTLSFLIVLLSVGSVAFYLSEQLSAPLAALAEGTRAVAQGNFSGNYPVQSSDELGALTTLFNQMTAYLADAKQQGEKQQQQIENAKAYLESVLANLSSGVLSLDEKQRLRSANASADLILGVSLQHLMGNSLDQMVQEHALLKSFIDAVKLGFNESPQQEWKKQIERISKQGDQTLLIRGTRLAAAEESGYVVVFDDITHILQTERQAAWGEVARRLAHEIKNPLTPIQLSAERLQYKLHDKLGERDAAFLERAIQTIVSQVGAMKNMVMEFSNYARAPAVRMIPLDLHQLFNEVMGLYEANSSPITLQMKATQHVVTGDATRLRQVVHNLLQNAHDALQKTEDRKIVLSTQNIADGLIEFSVCDNGSGIPEQIRMRLFEPYMTTKQKGTGLGLAIVKKIIEEHEGKVSIVNREGGGTCVLIVLPLMKEKVEVS